MRSGETELQMCIRHVAEQENRIARQDILVERLRESGSRLLDDALQLLAKMYYLLKRMHEHVARLQGRPRGMHQGGPRGSPCRPCDGR
jgi:hypothetical protein